MASLLSGILVQKYAYFDVKLRNIDYFYVYIHSTTEALSNLWSDKSVIWLDIVKLHTKIKFHWANSFFVFPTVLEIQGHDSIHKHRPNCRFAIRHLGQPRRHAQQWRIQDNELGGAGLICTGRRPVWRSRRLRGGRYGGGCPPSTVSKKWKMKLILVVFWGYVKWIWGGGVEGVQSQILNKNRSTYFFLKKIMSNS